MPILSVEIVGGDEEMLEGVAQSIADAAGVVFKTAPGRTWVKLRAIPVADYGENGATSLASEGSTPRPIFVSVLKRTPPGGEAFQHEVGALTSAVARACHREMDEVHIIYEPPAAGRVAFGGEVVE